LEDPEELSKSRNFPPTDRCSLCILPPFFLYSRPDEDTGVELVENGVLGDKGFSDVFDDDDLDSAMD
jgi:hypothetical protein